MKIEINNMPTFAVKASKIATLRAGDLFGVLTVREVEMLFKLWQYESILEMQQPEEFEKPYYNKREVCELLDVSPKTLDNLVSAGKLQKHYLGGRVVFLASDIDKAITLKK